MGRFPLKSGVFACRFFRYSALIAAFSLLAACAAPPTPPPAPKPTKPRYSADTFVLNLSLAMLAEENAMLDDSASDSYYEAVRTYLNTPIKKPETLPATLLKYKVKDQPGMRRILIPFRIKQEKTEFVGFAEVMNLLADRPYTPHDIKIVNLYLPKRKAITLKKDPEALRAEAERQFEALLSGKQNTSSLEAARAHMHLTRAFMEYRIRDAAYLSMDNAKKALADAAEEHGYDQEQAGKLAKEQEALESELHRTMPFEFSFRSFK